MPPPTEAEAPRILIVDDQVSNVRLLEHTLRRAGYVEVMSTTDPCTVIALHLEHRYDLILLDLQMPEMDGFAVLAELQKIRPLHPVAVLVISAGSGDMPAAMLAWMRASRWKRSSESTSFSGLPGTNGTFRGSFIYRCQLMLEAYFAHEGATVLPIAWSTAEANRLQPDVWSRY